MIIDVEPNSNPSERFTVDLYEKLTQHLARAEALAKEAIEDDEESFSARASALSTLTSVIDKVVKNQEVVVNMTRLQEVERILIRTVQKYLTDDQMREFLNELERI